MAAVTLHGLTAVMPIYAETTFWHTSNIFWISAQLTIWKSHRSIYLPTPLEQDNRFMADKTSKKYKG